MSLKRLSDQFFLVASIFENNFVSLILCRCWSNRFWHRSTWKIRRRQMILFFVIILCRWKSRNIICVRKAITRSSNHIAHSTYHQFFCFVSYFLIARKNRNLTVSVMTSKKRMISIDSLKRRLFMSSQCWEEKILQKRDVKQKNEKFRKQYLNRWMTFWMNDARFAASKVLRNRKNEKTQ